MICRNNIFIWLGVLTILLFLNIDVISQHRYIKDINSSLNKSEKEAIIILPGFGDSKKGRKEQFEFFREKDFDIYIPLYKDKETVDNCVKNFEMFYEDEKMSNYKKVHVFSYIIGSWTVNKYINDNGVKNIRTIVYDRSPIQERTPYVAYTYLKRIALAKIGPILKDFVNTPYPAILNDSINIGIIIENKATKFMRIYKKKTLRMGPINWQVDSLLQSNDDFFYTWLNHDQMYKRFDIVGNEIIFFINNGKFTDSAKKEKFNWDPFVSYKKEGFK